MKTQTSQSLIYVLAALTLIGCSSTKLPRTLGERNSGYSYIPIDPLPIFIERGRSCGEAGKFSDLLESLPDQAVRLAIGEFDASGSLTFGPVAIGVEGRSYQVILDYISVDASQLPVFIHVDKVRRAENDDSLSVYQEQDLYAADTKSHRNRIDYRYSVKPAPRFNPENGTARAYFDTLKNSDDLVVFPVYFGVGLRLTATVTVIKGKVTLSSLGALAAEANAGKLTGTLVVQTLGITGPNVSAALPLPSAINETTIQNAILALGSIKALLHDQGTTIRPRVVGIYNPIGGGQEVVNGVISVLAEQPITWFRPCGEVIAP